MKNVIGAFLLFVVMAMASQAMAGDLKINYIITSAHLIPLPEGIEKFNTDNSGIGFEYHFDSEFYVMTGFFKNSFYKTCEDQYASLCDDLSVFLGGGFKFIEDTDLRVSMELGLANGYDLLKFPKIGNETAVIGDVAISFKTFDNQAVKVLLGYPMLALEYQFGFDAE